MRKRSEFHIQFVARDGQTVSLWVVAGTEGEARSLVAEVARQLPVRAEVALFEVALKRQTPGSGVPRLRVNL